MLKSSYVVNGTDGLISMFVHICKDEVAINSWNPHVGIFVEEDNYPRSNTATIFKKAREKGLKIRKI